MTPQAKQAIMQLMGQTYGQLKKQDDMLVGQSGNLKPKSAEMKNMVENLVRTPVAPPPGYAPQPQQPAPQPVPEPVIEPVQAVPAPITPEQAIAELQGLAPAGIAPEAQAVYQEEQGMFDFSEPAKIDLLINAVKESNLLLKEIKVQLESNNVRPKRKSAKAKVAD